MITFLGRLRLVLAVAGMIFLLIGIASESRLIVWGAIALLGMSLGLRMYLRKRRKIEGIEGIEGIVELLIG